MKCGFGRQGFPIFAAIRRHHALTYAEHRAREDEFEEEPFIEANLKDLSGPIARGRNALSRHRCVLYVAGLGDEVVGHLLYTRYSTRLHPYAVVVSDISIAPAHRKSGFGLTLIEDMIARESRRGITNFAATIWPENTASHALFARAGFTIFENRGKFDGPTILVQWTRNSTVRDDILTWGRTMAAALPVTLAVFLAIRLMD